MDTTKMLRIEDVAKKLNVSKKSVRRYIHSGKLKSNKIGGVHRAEVSDLKHFLNLLFMKQLKKNNQIQ